MKDPALLQKEAADELHNVLEEYPFSGLLHALYAKALKNQGSYLYPKQLKRTAVAVPDRKILHHWTEQAAEVSTKPALDFSSKRVTEETQKPSPAQPVKQLENAPAPKPTPKPEPVAEQLKPAPQAPKEITQPKVAAAKTPTKETDLDLANLPASVRETVLRARKLRQKYGQEEEVKETPAPAQPEVKTPQPTPPPAIETEVEKQPEPVKEPLVERPVEEDKNVNEEASAPAAKEEIVEAPKADEVPEQREQDAPAAPAEPVYFELLEDEPELENEPEVPVAIGTPETQERHSFLSWLDATHEEAEPTETNTQESVVEQEDDGEQQSEVSFELDLDATFDDEPAQEEPHEPAAEPPTEGKEKASTERMQELYASFMDKPKIDFRAPSKEPEITAASLGTSGQAEYITETLAQVYVNQKLYNRAINAYEILRLKYPEKSSFFAARILEIKELLNEKDK